MWERNIDWLPLTHLQLGVWPATQTYALTGNQTYDLLVHRLVLNLLSHISQSLSLFLLKNKHNGNNACSIFINGHFPENLGKCVFWQEMDFQ